MLLLQTKLFKKKDVTDGAKTTGGQPNPELKFSNNETSLYNITLYADQTKLEPLTKIHISNFQNLLLLPS